MTDEVADLLESLKPAELEPTNDVTARARRRLDAAMLRAEQPPLARSKRRRRRAAVIGLGIAFAITTVAGASELLSDEPISEQVPASPGGGWTQLADNAFGKTRIAVSNDDQSMCAEFESDSPNLGGGGTCGGRFPESGINTQWSCGNAGNGRPTEFAMHGIAANDVKNIEIRTYGGDRRDVPVEGNTFAVVVTDPDDAPAEIVTERGDRRYTVTSPPLGCVAPS